MRLNISSIQEERVFIINMEIKKTKEEEWGQSAEQERGQNERQGEQFQKELAKASRSNDLIDLMNEGEVRSGVNQSSYDEFVKGRCIQIEKPELIQENYLMSYKLYTIKTKKSSHVSVWDTIVTRRFNDFQYLHHALLENYGGYVLPRLPSKNFLASLNMETKQFQDGRIQQLTKYLQRLLHHPQIRLSVDLKWFLFDEEYNFSSEKGEFISNSGALSGIKVVTGTILDAGKTLINKYIGKEQLPESSNFDGQQEIELRIFVRQISDLLTTTKQIKKILASFYQEQIVMGEFNPLPENDQVSLKESQQNLSLLVNEFEDICEFIENCSDAINRSKQLKQELIQLEREQSAMTLKEKENPRNRELDSVRSKLQKLKAKYERWIASLKKELSEYTTEGKSLMEDFVKRLVQQKKIIYQLHTCHRREESK